MLWFESIKKTPFYGVPVLLFSSNLNSRQFNYQASPYSNTKSEHAVRAWLSGSDMKRPRSEPLSLITNLANANELCKIATIQKMELVWGLFCRGVCKMQSSIEPIWLCFVGCRCNHHHIWLQQTFQQTPIRWQIACRWDGNRFGRAFQVRDFSADGIHTLLCARA